ncbi:hypothetical protein HmCmsJML003_00544 [Escherichia coli]|nr:hypothetical protein HmCmsJML003_00544 [Escherichia coli]
MQPVLRPPPRRIRLRLQPPRLIILAAGDAPVGMLLLHHPLQATLAFRVQHLPPVQAVRDDYPALQGKITKARSPQGLTPDSFCPWLLFASYVLTLP